MIKLKYVKILSIFHTLFCIILNEVLCSVSDCTCGSVVSPSGRIVGGENATENEFPWQVSLYDQESYHCGGSLINNMFVLTAAHCLAPFADRDGIVSVPDVLKNVSVVLGAYEMKPLSAYSEDEEGINVQKIVDVIYPENFDFPTYANDICLLKLEEPLEVYTSKILPICLPSTTESYKGKIVTVSGWGKEFRKGQPVSILKKREDLEIISDKECYMSIPRQWVEGKIMMCTHGFNRGPCDGDAGGPLMMKNDMNKYEQIGIISFGFGCESPLPNVFTRLSTFKNWIENQTIDATYCEH